MGQAVRRRRLDRRPPASVVLAELFGTALMCAGGLMGGTLVYRNQFGVDPRYAGAGKWKEETVAIDDDGWAAVAQDDELDVDQMKLVRVNGLRIVVGRTEKGYVAFEDRCTHKGGSLAGGMMICSTVQCPWHGSQFDAVTGEVEHGPAEERIRVYQVELREGTVRLQMTALAPRTDSETLHA
jgi:nitrite reductase/ring-hydroxylating ferredoxin subunit